MAKPIQIVNSIKIEQGTKTLVSITFVLNFLIKFPFVVETVSIDEGKMFNKP